MSKGEMSVMGREGDLKHMWDPNLPDEVEHARKTFNDFVTKKKYLAFSVKGDGDKGSQIREFNPDAGKIILVPPMQGG